MDPEGEHGHKNENPSLHDMLFTIKGIAFQKKKPRNPQGMQAEPSPHIISVPIMWSAYGYYMESFRV